MSAEAFVQTEKANCPVPLLYAVFDISRSRYCKATKKTISARASEDARLRLATREIDDIERGSYGSPRIRD